MSSKAVILRITDYLDFLAMNDKAKHPQYSLVNDKGEVLAKITRLKIGNGQNRLRKFPYHWIIILKVLDKFYMEDSMNTSRNLEDAKAWAIEQLPKELLTGIRWEET